jgi:hypothetical protein
LERFCRTDDIWAAKAISVALEVKSHAPDIHLSRTRIPRMTESSFSFSSSVKPLLLENRITVLRLAAEALCFMEGTEPIDLRQRRTLADLLSSGRLTINETLRASLGAVSPSAASSQPTHCCETQLTHRSNNERATHQF